MFDSTETTWFSKLCSRLRHLYNILLSSNVYPDVMVEPRVVLHMKVRNRTRIHIASKLTYGTNRPIRSSCRTLYMLLDYREVSLTGSDVDTPKPFILSIAFCACALSS